MSRRVGGHVGFDDSGWPGVTELADDHVELTESVDPPVRVIDVRPPTEVWARPDGRLVVDFGANIVGRLRIDAAGLPAGTRLHLRHGEEVVDGEVYTANLRTARAHDIVVTGDGPGDGPIEPTFTFHGFRYAEVIGHPGPPDAIHESVRAVVLASDLGRVGMFECSDEATNRLHENVVRTIRGNTVGLPTDCPQRDERLGWMADTQLIAPTIAHLFDSGPFFDQWLLSVRDGQSAERRLPRRRPQARRRRRRRTRLGGCRGPRPLGGAPPRRRSRPARSPDSGERAGRDRRRGGAPPRGRGPRHRPSRVRRRRRPRAWGATSGKAPLADCPSRTAEEPLIEERAAVEEVGDGGCDELCVRHPAEPLVALRAVGRQADGVAPDRADDVLVEPVRGLVGALERPDATEVAGEHDGAHRLADRVAAAPGGRSARHSGTRGT